MIWASEVRIKTSIWNGKTVYVTMKPVYQYADQTLNNNQIIDFDIVWDEIEEQFQWTIIERVDAQTGLTGNLVAMLAVNQLQKYVGAVDNVQIMFNNTPILKEWDKNILQSIEIGGYGALQMYSLPDGIARTTADRGLYLKEIDDGLLECLPDWIRQLIHDKQLSFDLPAKIKLNKSRNAVMNQQDTYNMLQPYLFKIVIEYVLNQFCHHNLKIPMLPEDYLYNNDYFRSQINDRLIQSLSSTYNKNNGVFDRDEQRNLINSERVLDDRSNMASFLTLALFNNRWMKTSLSTMKQEVASKSYIINEGYVSWRALQYAKTWYSYMALKADDEDFARGKTLNDQLLEELSQNENAKWFLTYCQSIVDNLFSIDTQKVIVDYWLLPQTTGARYYGSILDLYKGVNLWISLSNDTIYDFFLRWQNIVKVLPKNLASFVKFNPKYPDIKTLPKVSAILWNSKGLIENNMPSLADLINYPNNQEARRVVHIIAHELAHHLEKLFYGDKRSTHEKDTNTDYSFESLNRLVLTMILRWKSFADYK
jgi:hypothetical protein